MEVVSGERIVRCHAIMNVVIDVRVVECHASIDVVIGVRVVLCHQVIDHSGFRLSFTVFVETVLLSLILLTTCQHRSTAHFTTTPKKTSWNLRIDSEEVCSLCMLEFGLHNHHLRQNSFVAHLHSNSSRECCIFRNFRKLENFLQCFESLKTFAQSVSRCPIIAPWSVHQRIHFLRLHIFQ